MAALFQCFGKKRRIKISDDNDDEHHHHPTKDGKCKCTKVNKLLQCPECKSTLHGYWAKNKDNDKDGAVCAKNVCEDRDSRSSVEHESNSDGHSPTTISPRQGGNFSEDYRPNIPGMSYMPVSKEDPNYNMNHKRRGKALIFNFDKWENTNIPTLDLSPRAGSRKDKMDLAKCLKGLSFEVETFDNLKRQQYDGEIDRVRREDHSDADCLVIAVMTHGEKNSIYLSDGSLIPVNSVWEEFEANACPTLAGKPKIFLIQACRGDRYDHGTQLSTGRGVGPFPLQNDVIDSGTFSYVIPNAADIIVAFSCPLGHYSWRHPERGSWFIQSICKVFNRSAYELELQNLLTAVAREVAINYQSNTTQIESDRKKQVPSTSSTLIRNVNFSRKPLVTYRSIPATIIANGQRVESPAPTIPTSVHHNGGGNQIRLEDVEVAVAQAQSVAGNELMDVLNVRRPDELPILSIPELAIPVQILKPVGGITQVDANGVSSSDDLSPEDPTQNMLPDKSNLSPE